MMIEPMLPGEANMSSICESSPVSFIVTRHSCTQLMPSFIIDFHLTVHFLALAFGLSVELLLSALYCWLVCIRSKLISKHEKYGVPLIIDDSKTNFFGSSI